jgi:hypothetical protein
MATEVNVTDEFVNWWDSLNEDEQKSVNAIVMMAEERGTQIPFPYSSKIESSRHGGMRELRVQHKMRPLRLLYAFDPHRDAVILLGGDKTCRGNNWYKEFVPKADDLFDGYLEEVMAEDVEPADATRG